MYSNDKTILPIRPGLMWKDYESNVFQKPQLSTSANLQYSPNPGQTNVKPSIYLSFLLSGFWKLQNMPKGKEQPKETKQEVRNRFLYDIQILESPVQECNWLIC